MKLLVLGSGGTAPSKYRACSSFLLDGAILVDVGPGSVLNLRRFYGSTEEIDRVLITHLHGDHLFDFPSLIWAMASDGRKKPLEVYGPRGLSRVAGYLFAAENRPTLMPSNFVNFEVKVREVIPGESFDLAAYSVRTAVGVHPVEDLAYRVKGPGDETVTFSGDTSPAPSITSLATGSDLLVHEATFLVGEESMARSTGHSTAGEAGKAAKEAGVGFLVLSHVAPRLSGQEQKLEEQAEAAGVPAMVASDGLLIKV